MSRMRAHVIVTGRVQGVWFRESTRQRAVDLGLSGWVRNLADGRVEAVFEGELAAVRAALDFVREGPPLAQVNDLQLEEGPAQSKEQGFEVRF